MSVCEANKQFWLDFIRLYKTFPELWKVKSEVYRNRYLKDAAYDKMAEKLREIDSNANRDLVRIKINVIRSSYRRELKRLIKNKAFGIDYEPTLWYFNEIDFLREDTQLEMETQPNSSRTNRTEILDMQMQEAEENEDYITVSVPQPSFSRRTVETESTRSESKRKRKKIEAPTHCIQFTETESEIISKTWSFEFCKLRPDQQLFAKKAIEDILFEARLGNLHRNSVVINHVCPLEMPTTSTSFSEQYVSRSGQSPSYSNISATHSERASPNPQVIATEIKMENWEDET